MIMIAYLVLLYCFVYIYILKKTLFFQLYVYDFALVKRRNIKFINSFGYPLSVINV